MKFAMKVAGVGLSLIAVEVFAAVLPGAAQPEQVSRALTEEEFRPAQAAPSVTTPEQKEETPGGEAAKKIKFQLNGIVLEGNRIYSTQQLRPIYQNKLGKTITVAELFGIVQDITNYYRNNGYIISRAILPPQHVKGGVVKIQIIEGFIDKVDATGQPRGAKCLVKAYGRKISECRPLSIKRMEHYLLIANEIPGTSVKAVLSLSKTTTGAADLTLVTESKPFMGYISYDNYGTRYIGPQQMTANLAINSIFASGDSTQGTVTKTPKGSQLSFLDVNYSTAFFNNGTRWQLGGTKAHTRPGFVLKPVKIDGVNYNYYTGLTFPTIRSREKSLTWILGFNYLDSHVTTFDIELYTDHIRSLSFGGSYNFVDSYRGSNLIYGDIRKGLPILGYTSDTNPNTALTSRPGGHADYTKVDVQLSRLQAITQHLSLFGLIKGQYAFEALLAAEQFTFGGSQLGRGYDVAELIGDRGLAGSLELRYDVNIGKFIQTLQPYIYYDAGVIWNILVSTGSPDRLSGTAMGIGTRFYFSKYVSGNLMWTQVLTKPIAAEELIGDGKRPRVFFSIVASI